MFGPVVFFVPLDGEIAEEEKGDDFQYGSVPLGKHEKRDFWKQP